MIGTPRLPLAAPLLAWFAACAPPAASVPVTPVAAPPSVAPIAAPLGGAPRAAAQVMLPPPERCAEPVVTRPVAPVFDDTSPLSVRAVPAGIALEAGGATAGRVLVAVAELGREPLHVEGFGASVRIYAHVAGLPREALIASVLEAAGLVTLRPEGREPVILDVEEAARRRREWALANIQQAPIETLLVPARHPVEIGAVLARLLLPCRGEIVAAPGRSLLVLRADGDSVRRMEALVAAVDEDPSKPLQMDATDMPGRTTFAVPEPDRRGCGFIAPRAAPDLARGKVSSEGAAVGALIREVARRAGQDVVVGCGGDRPVFFGGDGSLDPEQTARRFGLLKIGEHTYVDQDMESRRRRHEILSAQPRRPYHLRGFVVPGAAEVAVAAEQSITPRGSAVAYAPAAMVIAGGDESSLSMVEALVKAWPGVPAPGAR